MTYDDEAETLVRSKAMADSIMRELATRLPPPEPPAGACEVVVLPPPRAPAPIASPWPSSTPARKPLPKTVLSQKKLVGQRRKKRRDGTKLHWAVFAMTAAIAVAVWKDPPSRAFAAAELSSLRADGHQLVTKIVQRRPAR